MSEGDSVTDALQDAEVVDFLFFGEVLCPGNSLDALHRIEHRGLVDPHIVNGNDIGMFQLPGADRWFSGQSEVACSNPNTSFEAPNWGFRVTRTLNK